ncbi:MAG: OsmC family protein [Candidatus Cloacimonadales bacterium]
MAKTTFKADVKLMGKGTYCEGTSRDFTVGIDEPKELGGTDKAMNPVEMLLNALGGCMSICAASFAKKNGVKLDGCRVEVEGDLDPDGFLRINPEAPNGFSEVRYKIIIDSPSPQENIEKLIAHIEDVCPVSNTLQGVKVIRKM